MALLPPARATQSSAKGWSWALPAAIVVVDLAAIGNFSIGLSGAEVTDTLPILGTYVLAVLVGDGVALVAWWWACRWPLGIGAIASAGAWLAAIVENPETISAHRTDVAIAAIAIALGLVAVAIGPVLRRRAVGARRFAARPRRTGGGARAARGSLAPARSGRSSARSSTRCSRWARCFRS